MHLDETILQSNTCIELIRYIQKIYPMTDWDPKSLEEDDSLHRLEEDYIYIMRTARKALKRRSSGFKLADIFNEDEGSESDDSNRK